MKALFVVTHLLGSGHLSRVLTLARAFAAQGIAPTILSGGLPVAHLDCSNVAVVQLPPVRSDGVDFSTLLDADGNPATPEYLAERQAIALSTLEQLAPDALITELFPFGRKSLSAEFTSLLQAAQDMPNRPVILASIRDILAPPRKPKKAERAEQNLNTFYDGVLVHSDETVTPLEASWPVTPDLKTSLKYTGFVTSPLPKIESPDLPKGDVLVSAGGGAVGRHVFETAIEAAWLSKLNWRILVGGADAHAVIAELQKNAPSNAIIEPARPDFRQLLQQAACSLSLCGYNTALDILQTGCPAVFVPFDEGVEVEQTLRARSLAHRAGIEVLYKSELSPQRLLDHLDSAMSAAPREVHQLELDGAQRAAQITKALIEAQGNA